MQSSWDLDASFFYRTGDGVRKSSKKAVRLVKYLLVWPALGRGCIRFFFSAAIHGGQGQGVSP